MATPPLAEPPLAVDRMTPLPYRVERVRRETRDTRTLEVVPEGEAIEAPAPGQFNMLYTLGQGEVPISISGDPARGGVVVHTVRSVGAVTRAICRLKRGDRLGVRGPFGNHWPVDRARGADVLIIAGGIGLAPLRPLIYEILAHRRHYGRISVLYGTRTPADMLYLSELHAWRGRFDLNVEVTVDHTQGEIMGHVGVVTNLIAGAEFDPIDSVAFVCGPEIMMRYAISKLLELGVDADEVYISMERNMQCAVGYCGHCQLGPYFVCRDGPVFRYADVAKLLRIREL